MPIQVYRENYLESLAKRIWSALEWGMRGVYIGKGFRVSLNGFSMWDKGSLENKVWETRNRVRTAKSRVRTRGIHRADGGKEEEVLEGG